MKSISVGSSTLVLVLSLTVASCLGDKTVDDYRQQKVQEEIGRIQAIEGTYRGALISQRDEQPLGGVTIELHADTQVQPSSDNLSSEQQAIIRGTISYAGAIPTEITFEKGTLGRNGKDFKGEVTINDSSDKPVNMTLQGEISEGIFTGSLYANGFEQYSAHFSLIKNGPAFTSNGSTNSRDQEIQSQLQIFTGIDDLGRDFKLTFIEPDLKNEQQFLKLFRPILDLKVNCDLGKAPSRSILFSSAHLDTRDQSLHANTTIIKGSDSFLVKLDCTSQHSGYTITGWSCFYSSGSKSFHVSLIPAPKKDGK